MCGINQLAQDGADPTRNSRSTYQLQLPESGLPSRRSSRSRRKKSWCGNRGVFKRAQKRTAQIRQTIDGCERFIFAIAQCRIDQTSLSHELHLLISLSIPDSEEAVPLLVSGDKEFMHVRQVHSVAPLVPGSHDCVQID